MAQKDVVFVSPLIDIVFKTMWLRADKDLRDYFNHLLTYALKRDFSGYSLGPNETGITDINNIANKVDVLLVRGDEKVDIEMNNTRGKNGPKVIEKVVNKSMVYLSYYITTYYDNDSSTMYKKPIKIEQINLNTFHCPENYQLERVDYKFVDTTNEISKDGIEYHHIYLPRLKEICYSNAKVKDIYSDFSMLLCESYEEMENLAGNNKGRQAVIKMLKTLGRDGKFMDALNRREDELIILKEAFKDEGLQEGREEGRKQGIQQGIREGIQQGIKEGIQQGIEQGIEQEKRQMIIKLKDKLSLEDLAESASISIDEVKSIINSVESN